MMKPDLRRYTFLAVVLSWAFSSALLAAPPGSGGSAAGFVYVVEQGAESVGAYRIDGKTGALTRLPGRPPKTDAAPYGMAIDAHGRWLFVTHGDASTVTVFFRNKRTGALSPKPVTRTRAGDYAVSVATDGEGRFMLYLCFKHGKR